MSDTRHHLKQIQEFTVQYDLFSFKKYRSPTRLRIIQIWYHNITDKLTGSECNIRFILFRLFNLPLQTWKCIFQFTILLNSLLRLNKTRSKARP